MVAALASDVEVAAVNHVPHYLGTGGNKAGARDRPLNCYTRCNMSDVSAHAPVSLCVCAFTRLRSVSVCLCASSNCLLLPVLGCALADDRLALRRRTEARRDANIASGLDGLFYRAFVRSAGVLRGALT